MGGRPAGGPRLHPGGEDVRPAKMVASASRC